MSRVLTAALSTRPATRRADIQGMRALAVLMVVLFHAGLPLPGGFTGVDVFFVISGYVITGMLVREHRSNGRISLGRFYARRFRRLTPALALVVTATVLAALLIQSPLGSQQDTAATGLGAMLLVANIVISATTGGYFDARAESNPLLNTWSLSVEEQFYLVFPALLILGWALAARRARHRLVPILVAVVTAVSFLAALVSAAGLVGPRTEWAIGFYGPVSRAWEFGAGALLLLLTHQRRGPASGSRSTVEAAAGAVLILLSCLLINESTPFPGPMTLLPVVGALLLIHAGAGADNPISRGLSWTSMVRLGDMSYSWYLWHWPMIVFAALLVPDNPSAVVVAAAVSLVVAAAAYRWVEQPLRHRQPRSGREMARLVLAVMTPPLMASGLLLLASSQGFWNSSVREMQAAIEPHRDAAAGCDDVARKGDPIPESCVFNGDGPGDPIYLVGDSNAGHFSEAVIGLGESLGRPVVITTTQGCPIVDLELRLSTGATWWDSQACRQGVDGVLSQLDVAKPGTVILSHDDSYWSQPGFDVSRDGREFTANARERVDVFRAGLASVVDRVSQAGHGVVLMQTVPHFSWDPRGCSLVTVQRGECQARAPRAMGAHQDVRDAIDDIARRSGAAVIDVSDQLCSDGVCATRRDGVTMYRDGGHLSVPGSRSLTETLVARFPAASVSALDGS